MRILVDCRHLSQTNQSGVGEYTTSILRALFLLSDKHEYILFSAGRTKPNLTSIGGAYPFVKHVHVNTPNKLLNIKTVLFNRPTIDQYVGEKIDLIFLPNLNIISLPKNIPTVLTIHDLSWHHFPEYYSWKMNLWHKILRPIDLISRSRIIAPSNATALDLVNTFSIQETSVHTIPHGISPTFRPMMEARDHGVRSRYKLPKRFALFVGTLEPRKNVLSIIEAMKLYREKSHDDLHLVLAGSWGWNTKTLRHRLREKDVRDWVHHLGYVPSTDKPALYRSANLFVWPSFYEGFGLPVLEAMACGAPVITSPVSSIPELAGNAAMYVDPFNIQDLAEAVNQVISSIPLQEHMKKAGLTRSHAFTWETAAKQTLAVFEKSLN